MFSLLGAFLFGVTNDKHYLNRPDRAEGDKK